MTDSNTQKYFSEAFRYDNGKLFWKERPLHHFSSEWNQKVFNSRQAGSLAGTMISGYRMVNFSKGRISVHRIVFLMHHGYLPEEVDHINGVTTDNRIENLRPATHAENLRNNKTPSSNTSGRKGVYRHKRSGKWMASIRDSGKWKYLGVFALKSDAISARERSEKELYGEFSNGR